MQELKLANDLFDGLEDGSKRATVRSGIRTIVPGIMLFTSTDGKRQTEVIVTEVRYKLAKGLTDEEALDDGARSAADLYSALKRFYPDLGLNDPITIVFFEAKET